jgi:hypothetical protein
MKTNLQALIELRDSLRANPALTMNEHKVLGKLITCVELLEADVAARAEGDMDLLRFAKAPAPVHTS